ncbi:restriction endonuclease fold toxin [Paenibacillus fonticola]|uniref:restriction endonuclease fold toxin n=1 Tax=Paenibacillus fonticola TaxID=379896 RepID=UPI00037F0BEA|nr:restriction endonuclease fold toxin [Paenibacillus fonticola]
MSLLTEGIGYESIRLYGPFQPQHIQQLHIHRAINEHAYLQLIGILPEEQGAAWIGQTMDQEPIVIRQLDEQGQSVRTLFHGMITRLSIHCVRGVYTFELEAASHSYQLDVKLKNRSYQEPQRTYDDLVTALVRKYKYGDAIDTVTDGAKLDTFLLQYQETDWAFLKRLASRFGSVLVPEVTAASPKIFFGLPVGKLHKLERNVFYRVRKTFHELAAGNPGEPAGSYVTYTIESLEYYALGDVIDLPIGQGKELVVVRAETRLEDGMLRTRYDLQAEQEIRYARVENDQITGVSLLGKVLHIEQDRVQLQLNIDPEQHPAACWFPVATRYVADAHSGWYDMPEIGDQVELYIPTNREQDAYVTDALRQQRALGQPNVKVWQHAKGSGIELSEQELTLHSSGKVSITLHETSGVTISSSGNVQIQGGSVKMEAGKGLSLKAGTALYLKGGASSMVLDGETDLKAPVVKQEGTVKAPVIVTDLPPVWEPEIVSVQAYEASKSSAASHTSSGSGDTPTAKITSPAVGTAANNKLVTESKLVGSIPVMTGVLLGALGGPANKAVGVALQATAVIPVRGAIRAMPALGSLHPLKQVAALLVQGLINMQIYEQEREAYYSKWILGKMMTSARQLLYSNGPLDFVRNVLKESNDMYQAYQQVPVDVRRRWEDKHTSSIEPVTYDYSQYTKRYADGMVYLERKGGGNGQEDARATIAYNSDPANFTTTIDDSDPIMEQTKAAMNGINYWTGEKISKIQAFGIIAGGMLYQYEAIRGNFRGNRNIKTVPNGFSDPKYKKKGETSTSSNNPNKPPETKGTGNVGDKLELSDKARELMQKGHYSQAMDRHYEDMVRKKTGGKEMIYGEKGRERELDSVTKDAVIETKRSMSAVTKPDNFMNKKMKQQLKATIQYAEEHGLRVEYWFKYGVHPKIRKYLEEKGVIVKTGMGD